METPTRMIEFRGVTKCFGTLTAVDNVAFSIARGILRPSRPEWRRQDDPGQNASTFTAMSSGAITIDGCRSPIHKADWRSAIYPNSRAFRHN